ncbi:hypothetical protein IGB42_01768 [Andreprevotia sp. IGB-42]|uniref:hypothetical protein n=1 Tax=Andreprevotia sp. IGB-42 TaxID=2497473 RepID=UPI001356CF1A|nr:hypothetical protein [Andreprevotia sp. IGB-42]KAF0813417.1 hypothetical protein IGB42_01768 [Andreprevotia sp. IGB-42]
MREMRIDCRLQSRDQITGGLLMELIPTWLRMLLCANKRFLSVKMLRFYRSGYYQTLAKL